MNKREIVVYVAGPYRAETKEEVEHNIKIAAKYAMYVRQCGFSAIVPHLESMYYESSLTEQQWLEHGVSLMKKCDAVLDIRRGQKSDGTEQEVTAARIAGIPVFDDMTDMRFYFLSEEELTQ